MDSDLIGVFLSLVQKNYYWVVIVVVLAVAGMLFVAFIQGRKVSIWSISVGPRPSEGQLSLSKKPFKHLIRSSDMACYLTVDGVCRHIPDPETLEYLGELYDFRPVDIRNVGDDEMKTFSDGCQLPSILQYYNKK